MTRSIRSGIRHLFFLFNSLTTWKNQKLCPPSLSIQGMEGQRPLVSPPVKNCEAPILDWRGISMPWQSPFGGDQGQLKIGILGFTVFEISSRNCKSTKTKSWGWLHLEIRCMYLSGLHSLSVLLGRTKRLNQVFSRRLDLFQDLSGNARI